MGTYTANYNLFMPTVGEQGWGDLVNGNFTTIDTTMKGLNTRVGTLESTVVGFNGRITNIEGKLGSLPDYSNMTITVTPSATYQEVVCSNSDDRTRPGTYVPICPYNFGIVYTGTINYKAYKNNSYSSYCEGIMAIVTRNINNAFTTTSIYKNDTSSTVYTFTIPANTTEVVLVCSGVDANNTSYYVGFYYPIFS